MPEFNLVGPTYTAPAGNSDCQRTVNLYPEMVESAMGKGKVSLESAPGQAIVQDFASFYGSRINAVFVDQERCWVVGGGCLWEWNGTTAVNRGVLADQGVGIIVDNYAISMASNGKELLICASEFGTVSRGVWLFTIATNVITPFTITSHPDVYRSTQCAFLDGYFILFPPVNATTSRWDHKFYISGLYDGTSWNPLDYASAESSPDRVMAIIVDHRELWLFGRQTTEVFVNTGASPFPLERVGGAVFDCGCIAYRSLCKLDNSLFFVGGDQRGTGVVYRTNGYQAVRVSNHAVEASMNTAGIDLEECYAYTYSEAGHTFYCLTISAARATWVYDATTGMWHERGAWNGGVGDFIALPFVSHAFFKGKHLICGPETGAMTASGSTSLLFEQSINIHSRAGLDVRRMRTTPHLSAEQSWQFYHQLQLDLETMANGTPVTAPAVHLDWSDDGGKTWSNVHSVTLPLPGASGGQKFRTIWRRLGRGRDRVFRFYVEGQYRWSFINGYLQFSQGTGI